MYPNLRACSFTFSEATGSKEHLVSSAPLPEACGHELEEKGLKRGRFALCCEDKIGEGLRTASPSVLACLGGW